MPLGVDEILGSIRRGSVSLQKAEAAVRGVCNRLHGAPDPADAVFQAEVRAGLAGSARELLQALSGALEAAQAAVEHLVDSTAPTSRAGYLESLEDRVGPPPAEKDWQREELPAMLAEQCKVTGERYAEVEKLHSLEGFAAADNTNKYFSWCKPYGFGDNSKFVALMVASPYYTGPMARALRSRSPVYAGTTHAFY